MQHPSSILHTHDLKELANDIQFRQELDKLGPERQQIYFDTAGVMDMLLGWDAILRGGTIRWNLFHRPSMLVFALGYKNWLGTIHTLAPHTEELTNKLLHDEIRFPNNPTENTQTLADEFWNTLRLNIKDLSLDQKAFIEALRDDSVSIFKGVFLANQGGFWKKRYRYLVRDKQILQFSTGADYQLSDVTSHRLFRPILFFLNKERTKHANNYLDAIALCLLDEKLRRFEQTPHEAGSCLPLFFSDQEHILKAVKHFSQDRDPKDEHLPFTYRSNSGQRFLIVRNADFFVINGIYNALRESGLTNLLNEYGIYLESLRQRAYDTGQPEAVSSQNMAQISLKSYAETPSEENILLEFFQQWWATKGFHELKDILNEEFSHREVKDEDVSNYINKERERLRGQFHNIGDRIGTIRKIWNEFQYLPEYIRRHFPTTGVPIDVYKEIGPRLYYHESVCDEVQHTTDRIFRSVHENTDEKDSRELLEAESDVVNDLAIGLFDRWDEKTIPKDKIDRLARGLAVLWVYEKYDLINQVCDIVYRQCEARNSPGEKNPDLYPAPSIALTHAAAILRGRTANQSHTIRIIDCVNQKFGAKNYNVWIGLSYIHYLIWRSAGEGFNFPEWQYYLTGEKSFHLTNRNHLTESLRLSEAAYRKLDEDEKNDLITIEKKRERQPKRFYALNNYLYLLTICGEAETFKKSRLLAEKFQDAAYIGDIWQIGRFSDTLACYYLRMAFLATSPNEFKRNIEEAERQNGISIAASPHQNEDYHKLKRRIAEVNDLGFEKVSELMTQH